MQPNQPLYACRMDAQPIRGKLALWVVERADGCVINPVCDGSDFRSEIRDWPPQPTQLAEKFVEIVVASCGENQHSSHMQGRGAFASVQSWCEPRDNCEHASWNYKYPLLTLLACNVVTRKKLSFTHRSVRTAQHRKKHCLREQRRTSI